MNRKLIFALALAAVFAAPLSTAYADSHEDKDKKPELSPLIISEGDEKETSKPELISEGDEKETSKPELIAQDDDQPKKPKTPEPDYAA